MSFDPENRLDRLRNLAARYWKPLLSCIAVLGSLDALKLLGVPVGAMPPMGLSALIAWLLLAAGIFGLIVIRYPRVAFAITRWLLGPPPAPPLPSKTIFRGPLPYTSEDDLPGRGADADAFWMRFDGHAFFVLEGESGCGKTSFLNSAVIPKAEKRYRVVRCDATDSDPTAALDRALSRSGHDVDEEAASQAMGIPLLVVLDQFEALFLTVRDKVRERFFRALTDAISGSNVNVLLAIRSDYLDLLLRLCREVDPEQRVLRPESYFLLRAFSEDKAKAVLGEMLEVLHKGDPLLRQQLEDFGTELVAELLRPPRDQRLSRDDRRTVLPVELQMVGRTLELVGVRHFSTDGLKQLGGTVQLLRLSIEEAHEYVWRKTGMPVNDARQILETLVSSDTHATRRQTTASIAQLLKRPEAHVEAVLRAFCDQYIVKLVPARAEHNIARPGHSPCYYELIHEHLARILSAVPGTLSQKTKDADEQLRFWRNRTRQGSQEGTTEHPLPSWIRLARLFSQPVPLAESLRLWRFTRGGEDRRMLARSLRGFSLRLAASFAMITVPLAVWEFAWIRADKYQMRLIVSEAPTAQLIAGDDSGDERALNEWLRALVRRNLVDQALAIARRIEHEGASDRTPQRHAPDAFIAIADELAHNGEAARSADILEEALNAARRIEKDPVEDPITLDDRSESRARVGSAMLGLGRTEEALEIASEVPRVTPHCNLLCSIAEKLTEKGMSAKAEEAWTQAATVASGGPDPHEWFSNPLGVVASRMVAAGRIEQGLALARQTGGARLRSYGLSAVAAELIKKGAVSDGEKVFIEAQLTESADQKLQSTKLKEDYEWDDAQLDVAAALANAGKIEKALNIARGVGRDRRNNAPAAVAREMIELGKIEEALAVVPEYNRNATTFYGRYGAMPLGDFKIRPEAAIKLTKLGDVDGALKVAHELQGPTTEYVVLLVAIASTLREAHAFQRAQEVLDGALSETLSITDSHARCRLLSLLAPAFASGGRQDELRNILDKEKSAAGNISRELFQSEAFAFLAQAMASLRLYRLARLTADRCAKSVDRLKAYTAILNEFSREHDPELARRLQAEADSRKKPWQTE
jgi:tetratricopeptide (TPR) repeat protein